MYSKFHNHGNLQDINPSSEVLEIFKLIVTMSFTLTLEFVLFLVVLRNIIWSIYPLNIGS